MVDAKVYYTTDPVDDDIVIEQILLTGMFNRKYTPSGRKFKRWRIPKDMYREQCEKDFDIPPAPPDEKSIVMYYGPDFLPFYYVLME